MKKGKAYTSEFKARVALDALKGELTINEISTKYKIHATQIARWKQQALLSIKDSFSKIKKQEKISERQLIDDLYRQIGQLSCENDFLKKNVWT